LLDEKSEVRLSMFVLFISLTIKRWLLPFTLPLILLLAACSADTATAMPEATARSDGTARENLYQTSGTASITI